MQHIQIDIMPDYSEIVHYDKPDIPLYIRKGLLSYYPEKRAVCHWHNDLEIIMILSGELNYYINGENLVLSKGEALWINTGRMHYGYSNQGKECEFICILFQPSLLSSNYILYQNYIVPFLSSANITYIKLTPVQHDSIIDFIVKIYDKKIEQDPFFELEVIGLLYSFMAGILRICKEYPVIDTQTSSNDILLLRKMVSYIHENYNSAISLNGIAISANICKSKCCSLFQSQIHMTPFEFLNNYRLEKSTELLVTTNISITVIALRCGFNNSSYYSKLFFRLYHCTPREYRKDRQKHQYAKRFIP